MCLVAISKEIVMIRVAMISFWHVHARDYMRQALENPATEIVAAWDENPERGRAQATALGVRFYENLHELLAQPDIDAVIIDTPTNIHREVMVAAALAGKHIFTEKVVATTLHECNEILAAVEKTGVKLAVSLPRLYHGYTLALQQIVEQKLLGELTLVRIRLSHGGALPTSDSPNGWLPAHFYSLEQCGGGALIDLGCHPMYLARLFLGLPESVSAYYGYVTGREVEDNAVAVLQYPKSGALGIVEAGFVNRFSPFTIEIHGTEGSLFYGTPESKLLIRSTVLGEEGSRQWNDRTNSIPPDKPMAFQQWVTHIQEGTRASENIQMAVELTMLMEAANLSVQKKTAVRLAELVV
jgi:1,5-anhydro-D-fructose reductase (1,5-anhydro-D-mannitol-forming)